MYKNLLIIASIIFQIQVQAAGNTANAANVAVLRKLLLGSEDHVSRTVLPPVKGQTPDGHPCTIEVGSSQYGVAVIIRDETLERYVKFRASISSGTSQNFDMEINKRKRTLEASQVAWSADERGNMATKQGISLQFRGRAPVELLSATISNQEGEYDANEKMTFGKYPVREFTCQRN